MKKSQPTIREIGEDVVIDFGAKWFRCKPNGQVIAKIAKNGKVKCRPATSKERLVALSYAANGPLEREH